MKINYKASLEIQGDKSNIVKRQLTLRLKMSKQNSS